MKRSRLVVSGGPRRVRGGLVSVGTGAAAHRPARAPPAAATGAPARPPAQARLKHSPVGIPAGRWAAGSPQAAQLRRHQPNPARPAIAHLAPQLNRLAGVPGSPEAGSGVRLERDGNVDGHRDRPGRARRGQGGGRPGAGQLRRSEHRAARAGPAARAGRPARRQPGRPGRPADAAEHQRGRGGSGAKNWADNGNIGNGGGRRQGGHRRRRLQGPAGRDRRRQLQRPGRHPGERGLPGRPGPLRSTTA